MSEEPASAPGARAPGDSTPLDPAPKSARRRWLEGVAKALLFALGVGAVVLLVREAGPEQVLATLSSAGPWLPAIVALEAVWMSLDAVALRGLLGTPGKTVPLRAWARAAMLAYGIMILLPAGRAGGEVARASILAPYVGGASAAAAATRLQAVTLLANTAISVPCWVAVAAVGGATSPLAWMLFGNGLVTLVLGAGIVVASRRARVGGWLGEHVGALARHGAGFDEALRADTPWTPALAACVLGRVLQAVQYGLLLAAVGGALSVGAAFVSQGIHLVGAGLGDLVPNQVGVTEGAYRLFAPALGLEDAPARAIGIALVARLAQVALALFGLAAASLMRGARVDHGGGPV